MSVDYDRIREDNLKEYGHGTRQLAFFSQLYTDRTHFIFELIQNAEDAGATELSFTLRQKRLDVQHNGRAFTEADVRGICGIGEGTKSEDLTKIGRFGIGFKSVFAYTTRPEVHNEDEHFCIEDYVRPKAIEPRNLSPGQTLFILPFDMPDLKAAQARAEISEALNDLDLETMLFLRNLSRMTLSGADVVDAVLERSTEPWSDTSTHVSLTQVSEEAEASEWRVWSREIEHEAPLRVQVALALDGERRVRRLPESPLVVFFPTEKETFLGFLAQGPYRTTPARNTIPPTDPWNVDLVAATAALLRDAVLEMRDEGSLGTDVLVTLPIDSARFPAGSMLRPLYDEVERLFREEPVIPTVDGGYGRAGEVKIARGAGLRDLLTFEQFGLLFGHTGELRWVTDAVTQNQTPALWAYLRLVLGVDEVTPESVVNRLTAEFLAAQPDEWIVRLYTFLAGNPALFRSQVAHSSPARTKPIIRLEDGQHVPPFDAGGRHLAYLPTDSASEFPTVRVSIAEQKPARDFLVALGLVEPDVIAEVLEKVLPRYAELDPETLDFAQHEEDLRRMARAVREVRSDRSAGLRARLTATKFVRARNMATGEVRFGAPPNLFRESAHINAYFDSNPAAWIVGDEYAAWAGLLRDLGVKDHPRITARRADSRNYTDIKDWHGTHERGVDGFDPDAEIEELKFALAHPTVELSRYVWNDLLAPHHHLVAGVVEQSGRKEFVDPKRVEKLSVLGTIACSSAWLPSPDGVWVRPEDIELDALPAEFKRDEALARALGMASDVLSEVAQELGIRAEILRELQDPDNLAAYEEFKASRDAAANRSEEDDAQQAVAPQIHYAEALAKAFGIDKAQRPIEPEMGAGDVTNPALRRERVQQAMSQDRDAEPRSQDRFRPVPRAVWEAKDSATRHFLEEQYGGRCQLCGDTFAMRNGRPYFQALYLVSRTKARWIDRPGNVLCLCATCCAKLQHGPVEIADLTDQILRWRSGVEGGGDPRVHLRVCGVDAKITFTEKHLLELQEMVKSDG